MSMTTLLDIVSAERALFSGQVRYLVASGAQGELGIKPGHAPLLTTLQPGNIVVENEQGEEDVYYISGGVLEVQPYHVTVLSDTAVRAQDLDEAMAKDAERQAREALEKRGADFDYARAAVQLAQAAAQLRAIQRLRKTTLR